MTVTIVRARPDPSDRQQRQHTTCLRHCEWESRIFKVLLMEAQMHETGERAFARAYDDPTTETNTLREDATLPSHGERRCERNAHQ